MTKGTLTPSAPQEIRVRNGFGVSPSGWGVAADGSIVVQDPNAYFGRASLTDYLRGFNSAGITWTGELRGVVQLALRNPAATRFLVGALSQSPDVMKTLALDVRSTGGVCGASLDLFDSGDPRSKRAAQTLWEHELAERRFERRVH